LLCAERPARIGVDDETALLQSRTPTQIATVPFENKVDRWFADGLGKGSDRLLEVPVDDDKCGIDEQGMDGSFIPSYPKYIRKGEVLEVGEFI